MSRFLLAKRAELLTLAARRLVDEALAAFPALGHDAKEELFPRRKGIGRCRICGQSRELTREHIPPGSAFNKQAGWAHSILDWVRRTADGVMPGGRHEQGGNWGYTLCGECNHRMGLRYADEYRKLAEAVVSMLKGTNVKELEAVHDPPIANVRFFGADHKVAPRPGAIVREVLAMMCSLSADYDLAGRHPVIRRLLLDETCEGLPDGMSIGLTMYLGGKYVRYAGPTLEVDTKGSIWRFVTEVAHPPFAALMVLATNGPAPHVWDISSFTSIHPDTQQNLEGRMAIGFGHTPMPGDYRTKAMFDADNAPE